VKGEGSLWAGMNGRATQAAGEENCGSAASKLGDASAMGAGKGRRIGKKKSMGAQETRRRRKTPMAGSQKLEEDRRVPAQASTSSGKLFARKRVDGREDRSLVDEKKEEMAGKAMRKPQKLSRPISAKTCALTLT